MYDLRAVRILEGHKISHDYSGKEINLFSYRELIEKGSPNIGIPCRQNGLIVVDIDVEGPTHKNDGREWWNRFCIENDMAPTYTVQSASGGYHFYYRLPESVNPDTFSPPARLSLGVDLKWNGWVGAPPTPGYSVAWGTVADIKTAPPTLMAEISAQIKGKGPKEFEFNGDVTNVLNIHKPFSESQLKDLERGIEWAQANLKPSRDEWRDGLFSLKAGIQDEKILQDLALKWTHNQAFSPGDDEIALSIVERADRHGTVGPGTILNLIRGHLVRQGSPILVSKFTREEIIARSKVSFRMSPDGSMKAKATESNAAAFISGMFDSDDLYFDIRQDQYMFKGHPMSDVEIVLTLTPLIQSPNGGLGIEDFKMHHISGGLDILMSLRRVDPHLNYLNSIVWDGVERIGTFFVNYVGVEDSNYIRAVGKNFWISMAARGLNPGCKYDNMIVLEGCEGIRKSSLVQAIGGEDYTFTPSSDDVMKNTDELRKMHQSIIVELPELMGLAGQDHKLVKAFLAKPCDHIRGLYARKASKKSRGFVFVGTTNDTKYLSVDMGARRFWPVKIPKEVKTIDTQAIKMDRDQLFAEAVKCFKAGESWYEVPMGDLKKNIQDRVVHEPLMVAIKTYIPMLGPIFSISDLYQRLELGGFVPRGLNIQVAKRIENVLRLCEIEESNVNGTPMWGYKTLEADYI